MLRNFKIPIFISILLLFTNTLPAWAEEKATPYGLSIEEYLECVDKVVNEFYGPIKACLEKNRYIDPLCEKVANEQNKASDKEIARRCVAVPKEKSPFLNPTEQPVQDQSSDNNPSTISKYTQALVVELPKESDFQKIPKSDFKQVNPIGTASATLKSATKSANLTSTTFIGKIGEDGELILQLPDGKEVKLTDDKSAFEGLHEGLRPDLFRWRDISDKRNYISPKRNVYIEEIDCHILLEQERRNQEDIKRLGGITYASDWGVDNTIIVKPTGDCSYTNEGGPVRVLAEKGQVTFKTPSGAEVSANNADFGIGYNAKSAISIVEIYNGSITVTSSSGNSKTISATYGSEIKQIEVNKDGVMSEKIAIPLSQWQTFLAIKQEKKDEAKGNTLPIVGAIAIFGLGGIIFFLYRTGKLLSLFKIFKQKITDILGKINREKKTD